MKKIKKTIFRLIVLLACLVGAIKFIPPVNQVAREILPGAVLKVIGEKPQSALERGVDQIKGVFGG